MANATGTQIVIPGIHLDSPITAVDSAINTWFKHVDRIVEDGFEPHLLANSSTYFLFAGPPYWKDTYRDNGYDLEKFLYKMTGVGAANDFNEGEGVQSVQIGSIGSKIRIAVNGVSSGTINIGKLLAAAPNFMFRAYYHYVEETEDGYIFKKKKPTDPYQWEDAPEFDPPIRISPLNKRTKPTDPFPDLYGLWQEIFKYPFGLLEAVVAPDGTVLRKSYYEGCAFTSRGAGTNAGAIVINESTAITYKRIVPLTVSTVD